MEAQMVALLMRSQTVGQYTGSSERRLVTISPEVWICVGWTEPGPGGVWGRGRAAGGVAPGRHGICGSGVSSLRRGSEQSSI